MTEFTMGQDVPEPPVAKDTSVDKNKAILNYIMKSLRLGKALAYQKSFWKFIGILVLVSIAISILGILAAILWYRHF
jgi:hypothetical protein